MARLYHHSAITACSVLSLAMFRMEDRKFASGVLFVENGCFEKMWWADSEVFCEMVSWARCSCTPFFPNEVTHTAMIHKLIFVLMDFAQSDWR